MRMGGGGRGSKSWELFYSGKMCGRLYLKNAEANFHFVGVSLSFLILRLNIATEVNMLSLL